MAMRIAEKIVGITNALQIPYVFKGSFKKANRSRVDSFTGIGDEKALKILRKVSETFEVPTVTDIHEINDAEMAAEYVDVLQIPAFLVRQTDLVVAPTDGARRDQQFLLLGFAEADRPRVVAEVGRIERVLHADVRRARVIGDERLGTPEEPVQDQLDEIRGKIGPADQVHAVGRGLDLEPLDREFRRVDPGLARLRTVANDDRGLVRGRRILHHRQFRARAEFDRFDQLGHHRL